MQAQAVLTLIFFCLFNNVYSDSNIVQSPNGTFFYFAYGSNLLTKRLHVQNPSAVFYSVAKLKDHRLDFNIQSELWQGAAATIVEDKGEDVWGAVWTIDIDQMHNLDEQEGVAEGFYFAKNVTVTTVNGQTLVARTYEETQNPSKIENHTDLPLERRPSNTYLEVIALGAIESRLPAEYIGFIFSFPTNGKMATKQRREELGYPF
uniref:gamma-glutamylcyclotransferase n=1 Tax=Heliothis virescens TaxID=7102 RepID=A0A2A4JV31_HELVI